MRVYRTVPLADRLWARVDKRPGPDGCWLWIGATAGRGYGVIGYQHRMLYTHRAAYMLTYGPIPNGLAVCHRCDVNYPVGDVTYCRCCRPDHLFLGTNLENQQDMLAKGRGPVGDRNGARKHPDRMQRGEQRWCAKLTDEQVLAIRAEYIPYRVSYPVLAKKYGVSPLSVYYIVKRITWKHLP
jgi:hypothetical protein